MKRLFFISCLFFMGINIMAYQPIFVDGRIWTFFTFGESPYPDSENDTWSDTIRYNIVGDTIIDNQIYKILHSSDGLKSLLRENIKEQKIWKYNEHSKNENLIMDFSLSVGDKLESMHLICENISYIKDKSGNFLKQLSFDNNHLVWIEKYGHKKVIEDGASSRLLYVTEGNDTLIDFTNKQEYYKPIVVEGYNWNVVNRQVQLDGNNITQYSTISEKIEGDSIINDVMYKKLWQSTDDEFANYELIGLIREDIENQKVWVYVGDKEYLIYDFACSVGDKITTLKSLQSAKTQIEEVELTIKTIEEIEDLNGTKYNKYIATLDNGSEIVYYERFGSENGWYSRFYDGITGGGVNFMICAFNTTNELQFKPVHNNELDKIENCYINETKTDIETITAPTTTATQKLFHNGQVLIIRDGKTYNMMGIEVENIE